MYHTLNECITHSFSVYTGRMYHTLIQCIVHAINVVYTQQIYTLDECIHGSSVFYPFCIHTVQMDPTLYLHVEC